MFNHTSLYSFYLLNNITIICVDTCMNCVTKNSIVYVHKMHNYSEVGIFRKGYTSGLDSLSQLVRVICQINFIVFIIVLNVVFYTNYMCLTL